MYILAFETSCDDTSVAIMHDQACIALSTRTQMEHTITGWVVPEVAARSHANAIFPCIEDVLRETELTLEDMDYIACTDKPGLLPSLLTGMTVAKTLSLSLGKPLLWIDHIESHIFANYLERDVSDITFPALVLTVSWGHTELYLWKSRYELELVWQTIDDAAGEAFDKVSKMLGMGFPGGKKIADLATTYRGSFEGIFPEVLLEKNSLDFSFSGLKSAVKRYVDQEKKELSLEENREIDELALSFKTKIAFEFEETMVRILTKKLFLAIEQFPVSMILLAGWVSANTKLRDRIELEAKQKDVKFLAPSRILYSMDNAAMVGIRAYYEIERSHRA